MKFISNNIEDTKKVACAFKKVIENSGAFVCLYGDIGAGKTAFCRFLLLELGVKQKVTSPSFVILNEYKTPNMPIYHFDLYRLEKEGVQTIIDELKEYSKGKILTLVEWAEFSNDEIPFNRIEINIEYNDDETRIFNFKGIGKENEKIIEELESCLS